MISMQTSKPLTHSKTGYKYIAISLALLVSKFFLTFPTSCISETCIKMKINLKFLFSHFSVVSEKGKRQFPSGFLKLYVKRPKECTTSHPA